MAEYIEIIDRSELINDLNKFTPEEFKALVNMLILNQPAADVQEVRHGKWIPSIFGTIICSECKERITLFGSDTNKFYYCPNCGAKMDKG